MLAAGIGRRLYGDNNRELPKALLQIRGKTLIQRHVEAFSSFGIDELHLIVGHRSTDLLTEAQRWAVPGFISSTFNPRYFEGPKLSLAKGSEVLCSGHDIIFMDADVLYDVELLRRLVNSEHPNCLLIDKHFQSTDDFVKVCLNDGLVVDFGKNVERSCDFLGEWPGLLKMNSKTAIKVAETAGEYIERGDIEGAYEEVFREVILNRNSSIFGVEDISGIPWIEIDYKSDLKKAQSEIITKIT